MHDPDQILSYAPPPPGRWSRTHINKPSPRPTLLKLLNCCGANISGIKQQQESTTQVSNTFRKQILRHTRERLDTDRQKRPRVDGHKRAPNQHREPAQFERALLRNDRLSWPHCPPKSCLPTPGWPRIWLGVGSSWLRADPACCEWGLMLKMKILLCAVTPCCYDQGNMWHAVRMMRLDWAAGNFRGVVRVSTLGCKAFTMCFDPCFLPSSLKFDLPPS